MDLTGTEDIVITSPISVYHGQTNVTFIDVNITLVNDAILEGNETFDVTIDELSLSCNIVLGDIKTAFVKILDDDSKCTFVYCIAKNVGGRKYIGEFAVLDYLEEKTLVNSLFQINMEIKSSVN